MRRMCVGTKEGRRSNHPTPPPPFMTPLRLNSDASLRLLNALGVRTSESQWGDIWWNPQGVSQRQFGGNPSPRRFRCHSTFQLSHQAITHMQPLQRQPKVPTFVHFKECVEFLTWYPLRCQCPVTPAVNKESCTNIGMYSVWFLSYGARWPPPQTRQAHPWGTQNCRNRSPGKQRGSWRTQAI